MRAHEGPADVRDAAEVLTQRLQHAAGSRGRNEGHPHIAAQFMGESRLHLNLLANERIGHGELIIRRVQRDLRADAVRRKHRQQRFTGIL